MTETRTKAAVTDAVRQEWDKWDALIGEIGDSRMLEPAFAGGWTFKDIVAHLTGWSSRSLDRIDAIRHRQPEPPPPWPPELDNDDSINAWIYEQNVDHPLFEVLADASAAFARLRDAAESMSEEMLFDASAFPFLEGHALGDVIVSRDYLGHLYDEHLPDIRAWLARSTAA